MKQKLVIGGALFVIAAGAALYFFWFNPSRLGSRILPLRAWLNNPVAHTDWSIEAKTRCGEAPFLMPSSGYIGFIWHDSFRPGHQHQGIDIFGGAEPGVVPVYAAYDGYLTRKFGWKSSVIIRLPEDPLNPGQTIWTYYTHMADPSGESYIVKEFRQGSTEIFVEAGTLLGYQGNYSGIPGKPTGVHLHFSVVKDDGNGSFLNELEIVNTLDPSPYLGLLLNAKEGGVVPVVCQP